jgi:hydrogenase large subunit
MARIVIDPITRIEGHLRIEATVENGVVTDAYSSGTMVRGFEKILKGRDPRDAWAFTERACGVCTTVHALASVRCVEDALEISVPENAELIRNLMYCAQLVQDHVIHFYHLHALDWVDIVSALSADPQATSQLAQSISHWPKSSPGYFSDLKKRLTGFVESGQLGIFANGYWGHPQYKLPPEANLMAVAHYLEALAWQKELVKIHAIFGGKNPHPNYLVGGVPCSINLDEVNAINTERLNHVGALIDEAITIVEQLYLPDLLAIAPFYLDWAGIGGGLPNYLSYGDLPTRGFANPEYFKFPRGAILDRDLSRVHEVNPRDSEEIKEYISRPMSISRSSRSTRGSRRRAGAATRWKSARWLECWWPTPAGTNKCRRSSRAPWRSSTRRSRPCSRRSVARRLVGWRPSSWRTG